MIGCYSTSAADPDPNPDPSDPYVGGLLDPDPDPLVRGMDPDAAPDPAPGRSPDLVPFIIKNSKNSKKKHYSIPTV
jgi:hypothetical protein